MITLRVAVLSGTGLLVAALGAWLAVVRWEDGDKIATSVSALAAVAAVGVSVWAALHASRQQPTLVASRTGSATTRRGDANTGVKTGRAADGSQRAEDTGDARSTDGDANTGIQ
ncbi:hypothetical protein ACFQ9U_07940 [Streptomyces sp. NPDC056568]|uniref:hypothetical protein n=1 Tax=Streptomyces sp. NPDC056568 TaxID=3345866 RepID=UPI003679291B